MKHYIEQKLLNCEICATPFAASYEYLAEHPFGVEDVIRLTFANCPRCKHDNPLIRFMYARPLGVAPVVGAWLEDRPVRANSLRRVFLDLEPTTRPVEAPSKWMFLLLVDFHRVLSYAPALVRILA